MTATSITVKNHSGQITTFRITSPDDPAKAVLEQRIARGELTRVHPPTPRPGQVGRP